MKSLIPILVAALGGIAPGASAEAVRVVTGDALAYHSEPHAPGAGIAVVAGDPKAAGPYTIRVRFAPGATAPPHSHPDERVVTVLEGEYRFASGAHFDEDALRPYGPGTTLIVPGGTLHYSAAGAAGAVVQESGTGPTALVPATTR